LLAVFPEIHPVPRAEMDLALKNASANPLDVGEVPEPYTIKSLCHFLGGPEFSLSSHSRKGLWSSRSWYSRISIIALNGNIYHTIVKELGLQGQLLPHQLDVKIS
jgi:hypothetical protein